MVKHHGIVSLWFPVSRGMVARADPCTRLPELESHLFMGLLAINLEWVTLIALPLFSSFFKRGTGGHLGGSVG